MAAHGWRWRPDPYLLLLLGLSLFALAPLLSPGYFFSAHDGRHSVFFAAMFDEAVRDGALWPVWAMHHNQGYGYPTFLIQAPLAFYVTEAFVLLGLGVTQAVKAAWAVAFLAGAWGMYALVRRWALAWPANASGADRARRAAQAGVVAGLLYTYAPYHLLDIYVRSALAETMLMAWLPWTWWAFDRLIAGGGARGWQGRLAVAALCYGGLVLTHSFAILAVTPVLIAFVGFRLWGQWRGAAGGAQRGPGSRSRSLAPAGLALAAGVAGGLLAARFVLPLLVEGPLLTQEDWVRGAYAYARHWVHWGQFLSPFWGYGYSDDPGGVNDGMGFQVGLLLALLAVVGAYLLAAEGWRPRGLPLLLLVTAAALLYLMTPAAAWLWQAAAPLQVLQFPWRLLAPAAFLLSALGGLVVWQLGCGRRGGTAAPGDGGWLAIGLLTIVASAEFVRPQALEPVEPWREDGRAVYQFEREHPDMMSFPLQVAEPFTETPLSAQYRAEAFSNDALERLGIVAGRGQITRHYSRGHRFGGEVAMDTPGTVQVRLFAFPGWQVRLDGAPVAHRVSSPHALLEVDVPAGVHRIDVAMGSTPIRTVGAVVAGVTLLALIGLWVAGLLAHRPLHRTEP